jgi:uncharacterized membrane protein YfcA
MSESTNTPLAERHAVGNIPPRRRGRRAAQAVITGAPIGLLGGLIGLGGAEFRLPLLKAVFGYESRRAIVLNLCISLITVCTALVVRLGTLPGAELRSVASPVAALALGALGGAWIGASWASRISAERLERLIFVLLAGLGTVLVVEAFLELRSTGLPVGPEGRLAAGVMFGVGIGWVSSVLGVAGGELLVPTLVFAFGAGVKVAGTGSLLVSLPALCVGLGRYTHAGLLPSREEVKDLILPMGAGSVAGAFAGGLLVPFVPAGNLKAVLGLILLVSAYKTFAR